MKDKFSRFFMLLIILTLALPYTVFCATGTIIDGKTYVPVRGVFEEIGFTVSYDNTTATAIISDEDYTIQVPKNQTYFIVNGNSFKPDNPQKIVNNSLYLPLRAIGDSIGAAVSWDGANKMAHISYNGKNSYVSCKGNISTTVSTNKTSTVVTPTVTQTQQNTFVLNTNTKKFHYSFCSSVGQMSSKNKKMYTGTRDEIIAQGYTPCKRCNP